MLNIGEKIKAARKAAGMEQQPFADLLKENAPNLRVSNKTVSSWETNKSKPDIDTLNLIIKLLNLSPDYFFAQKEKPATDEGDGLSDKQRSLLAAISKLDEESQKQAFDYIEFLKSKRSP